MLKKDKNFLNDKNYSLLQEIRTQKDECLALENKVIDLKSAKKKLKGDLNQLSEFNRTKNVDEMLQNELEKIRTKSDEEIKSQKRQVLEIHASEIKILRDQVDHLKELTEKLDLKLKSKEHQ